ncbi:CDP-diacylglycerol--glycerol-3-phosphate 3-phosphatidyltransferase [Carnobacterium divergens]|uniref:CDP-diacylglycerol--glycerol-3-phosphate 3-phosphatidyltransferase n=1 Tax=Carnobacterium divergens TaxID=2748 RepID=A0A7Z8CYD0_CARDV|nr:CDP-diacylglycerol--glycerol-3-phosphate 3-phosphatidyltransferase [Carnobacterium divergens]TFI70226.1 CDP-diacylglycerol--glycerol-3-phosphate 3-phosphatidyltransferase [Carnobacterium divergens]TFI75220.1 CDP-diacylglycerol--glycerol-3-phosphate 3-phosphatidyltransferase [Carnobacterium divergens]TFI81044.1 CDP-diacylglycerol--glycerol-3-phosphate 3-phosphatidyltransferase [Carnobacterium divergens]TFI93451.1 CDP-diacylglycerol--glycerol-3-phosphate 3-phosphatidyltransferase [Carnobacteri
MNLPNKLTVLRIFMIPIFMVIVLAPLNWGEVSVLGSSIEVTQLVGAIIFALASITDWLDGKIARARGLVTNFGKFADPLADKMLVVTAFIVLVGQGIVPSWVVAIIICRELAVTGLRLLLVGDGEVMAAAMPGKIKTATQMVAIILLFLNNFPFEGMGFPFATIMLYICLFFTIYSGVDYFIKNKDVFKGSM